MLLLCADYYNNISHTTFMLKFNYICVEFYIICDRVESIFKVVTSLVESIFPLLLKKRVFRFRKISNLKLNPM